MDFSEKKAAIDNKIIKLFSNMGVEYISHEIVHTNKGDLRLMLMKGQTARDYRFVLDSVPVDDEVNATLKELFTIN